MTKKLIGYSRPNLNGNETPEEKEEKMDDYVKFLVKQVVENSNGDFGEYDEKAVDEILKKEHKKR